MANELRRQIREGVATVLTGLTTSQANVFQSRTHELQDAELPGLRIYTNGQDVDAETVAPDPVERNTLELVVEACGKASADLDDTLDAMVKEVRVALASGQAVGGAKYVQLKRIDIEMEGEAEREVGIARMTFEVAYFSARGAPDVAL